MLAIFMIGVKNQKDPRDSLHHGGWMMKIICWCILVILMFFLPNGIVSFYGTFYVYGSYYVYVPIIVLSTKVKIWIFNAIWITDFSCCLGCTLLFGLRIELRDPKKFIRISRWSYCLILWQNLFVLINIVSILPKTLLKFFWILPTSGRNMNKRNCSYWLRKFCL